MVSTTRISLICISLLLGFVETNDAGDLWKPQGLLAAVNLDRSRGHLCVPVRIGDRDFPFVVDTGATGTLVDKSLLSSTAPPTLHYDLDSLDGRVRVPAYKAPKMSIAGIEAPWIELVAGADLTQLRAALGSEIYGILGMDFLGKFTLHVDFDNETLLICAAAYRDLPPGKGVQMRLDERSCPTVAIKIGSLELQHFVIDTGFRGTGTIQKSLFERLERSHDAQTTGIAAPTSGLLGLAREQSLVKSSRIKLGEFQHRDLILGIEDRNLLGLVYFCRYRVTMDFRRGLLHLDPGEKFALRDRQDHLGMRLAYDDLNQLGVDSLMPGSVAACAGLLKNDRIVSINGKLASDWKGLEISLFFTALTADAIELVIVRGGKERALRIPGG